MALLGVRSRKSGDYVLCHIDSLSDALKDAIRSCLSSVCHGPSKASSDKKIYNYRNTLKEFIKRYDNKTPEAQLGMIGELLTHILILHYFNDFNTVSPYFNLEERNVKKGFDLVLFSKENKEVWITEVKSGELHKNKNANETSKDLLNTAKRDLRRRLNVNEVVFWENAINGAIIALDDQKDVKDVVVAILSDIEDKVIENNALSIDKNVVLAASLFSKLSDEIEEQEIRNFSVTVKREKTFKNVILLCIQKETYNKIFQFLKKEAEI